MKEQILLAMSGGIDSLTAAILLKEQGFDVIGVTFINWNEHSKGVQSIPDKLTPAQSAKETSNLCMELGIPHHILEISTSFEEVLHYFTETYWAGQTPNPCVYCNRHFKFKHLSAFADRMGIEKIASGHYARIQTKNGRFFLQRATDDWKDQTFMLWALEQEVLKRCVFPLALFKKEEVKQRASEMGFHTQSKRRESFNLCFVPDDAYHQFLNRRFPDDHKNLAEGKVIDISGKVLGTHDGYPYYTIGQTKGFFTDGEKKRYIYAINPLNNELIVAEKEALYQPYIQVHSLGFQKYETLEGEHPLYVRIRGKDAGMKAKVVFKQSYADVFFEEAVFAPAIGQSAVFYQEQDLVCGGVIQCPEKA